MISPKLRSMRIRSVSNKRLAYLREARKELREAVVLYGRMTNEMFRRRRLDG